MDQFSTALSTGLVGRLATPARNTRDLLETLSQELATADKADVGRALNHDFSALGIVSRDLEVFDSLQASIDRGKRIASTGQSALEGIAVQISDLREQLVPHVSGGQADPSVLSGAAEDAFKMVVALINTRQDDGAVFAAGRGDADAISQADTILTDLRTTLVGATSPDEIRLRVETFFGTGGLFETSLITTGTPAEFAFQTESDRRESFALRASDRRFSEALESIAKVLGVAESAFANGPAGQTYLAIQATGDLATAEEGVIELSAETGRFEARLETANDSLEDRRVRSQQARLDLIGADPFETATKIQEETARLETIYTLTARLSGLRLTNFL